MQNQKSQKASAEAQKSKAPSEEDFVGLVKYIEEREKGLSRYSDKLRTSLQRIFDVFGHADYCQICGNIRERHRATANEYYKTNYAANLEDHSFIAKVMVSEEIADTEDCIKTQCDDESFEKYRLVFHDTKMLLEGRRNCEMDITGVTTWHTTPEGTQRGGTPSRAELKQLVRSGRLSKFLALAAQKLSEAEQEYGEVAEIAEKMAKACEQTDVAQHTNAIAKREGAEEVGQ